MPAPSRSASSSATASKPYRVGRSRAGLGLFATEPIKKGSFIIEYFGPKLSNKEAEELSTKYLFELNSRWTIDGSPRENIARYINHGCKPNAEANIVRGRVKIRAIKTIQPGDEITYNYGKDYFNTFIKPMGCRCIACLGIKAKANGAAKSNGTRGNGTSKAGRKSNGANKRNGR